MSRVGQIEVDIVKAKKGKAKKIKGTLHFDTEGCEGESFQDASYKGKLV